MAKIKQDVLCGNLSDQLDAMAATLYRLSNKAHRDLSGPGSLRLMQRIERLAQLADDLGTDFLDRSDREQERVEEEMERRNTAYWRQQVTPTTKGGTRVLKVGKGGKGGGRGYGHGYTSKKGGR